MESCLILLQKLVSETKEIADEVCKEPTFMNILKYFSLQQNIGSLSLNNSLVILFGSSLGVVRKMSAFKDIR